MPRHMGGSAAPAADCLNSLHFWPGEASPSPPSLQSRPPCSSEQKEAFRKGCSEKKPRHHSLEKFIEAVVTSRRKPLVIQ